MSYPADGAIEGEGLRILYGTDKQRTCARPDNNLQAGTCAQPLVAPWLRQHLTRIACRPAVQHQVAFKAARTLAAVQDHPGKIVS